MPKLFYGTKTKFRPETQQVIRAANRILVEYAEQGFDLTLRQLYYQFVARGLIPNDDREYKRLGSIVNDARMAGLIDWDAIVDRTRRLRNLNHWADAATLVEKAAGWFGLEKWADQPYYVETWIEKDALVGVIEGICQEWDVPFFSCRGYTSTSEMWTASQRLLKKLEDGKKVLILHLGDHDPSGIDMSRDIEDRLSHFLAYDHHRYMDDDERAAQTDAAGGKLTWPFDWVRDNFEVRRIALTWEQIQMFNPPPNPAKLTDSRGRAYVREYGNDSWELDALDPTTLAGLIRDGVESVLDPDLWDEAVEREDEHKKTLKLAAARWPEVAALVNGGGSK